MKDQHTDLPSDNQLPAELEQRLAETPSDERIAIQKTWDLAILSQYADEDAVPDMGALWQNLAPNLDKELPKIKSDRAPRSRGRDGARRWRSVKIFAALATALVLVGSWFWLAVPQTFTAAHGEQLVVTLPDGSNVELNSGSRLEYRRPLLGWNRAVKLEGEAFFDVVKDTRQFEVTTFNASVSVLGTTFNVRAWEAESNPETAVVLVTGVVQLASFLAPDQGVTLKPGEMSRLSQGATRPSMPEAVNNPVIVWREGGLVFDELALVDILKSLERQYGVQVTTDAAPGVGIMTVFLESKPPIETVLDLICASMTCQIEFGSNGYRITLPENHNQ